MTQESDLIGKRIGPYEIESLVGRGGMASVYRAIDHNLRRSVAIKVLSATAAGQPDYTERFRQEAQMIASFRHPNIVQIYNFGEQDGLVYMVEQLLPGPTLGKELESLTLRGEYFSRADALKIVRDLAAALDAAHAGGVIHRDVKPENALWDEQRNLVLTDFGIARQTVLERGFTQTGTVIGTPDYMSPEQAQGMPLTPASDIYALGIVMYEVLTGRVPFTANTPMLVVVAHIQSPPPPLSTQRPDLPPALDSVFEQVMAKDPTQRFSTARSFAEAMEDAWRADAPVAPPAPGIHEQPTRVVPATPPPSPLPGANTAPASAGSTQEQPRQRPPAPTSESSIGTPPPSRPYPPHQPPPSGSYGYQQQGYQQQSYPQQGYQQPPPPPQQPPAAPAGRGFPIGRIIIGVIVALLLLLGGLSLVTGLGSDENGGVAEQPTPTPTLTPTPEAPPGTEPTPIPAATPEPTPQPEPTPEPPPPTATPLPQPPPPTAVPIPGRLAFVSNRDGNYEIYTINPDGELVNVTNSPGSNDFAPAWSPDGSQIAFHSDRDGNEELYIMNADGSNVRRITQNDYNDREPVWSPDGQRLAYWRCSDTTCPPGTWDIYLISANGINVDIGRVTFDFADDFQPDWAPGRPMLAFTTNRAGRDRDEVYMVDLTSGIETNLTNAPLNDKLPAWSPDGSQIAFHAERDGNPEIYLMNADGSNQRNISNNPAIDTQPDWSPDGLLVFTSNRDGNNELYMMRPDGSETRRLTSNTDDDIDAVWQP